MSEQTNEQVQDPPAVLAELRRAQADLKTLRSELANAHKEVETLKTQVSDDSWRSRALTAEIKSTLTSQGIKDVDRVLKYVKVDGLDFDDKGELIGLDDKLKEWRKDLPEVFEPKRRVGGRADIHADSVAEQQADPLREQVRAALSH
jgi:hypothetical protein